MKSFDKLLLLKQPVAKNHHKLLMATYYLNSISLDQQYRISLYIFHYFIYLLKQFLSKKMLKLVDLELTKRESPTPGIEPGPPG